MKFGIIGAGLSGLTAGRILAKAGHEVVVFEKSKGFGGRFSTRYTNTSPRQIIDHGCPCISGTSDEFRAFIAELEEKKLVKPWIETISGYTQGKIIPEISGREPQMLYIAPRGMNSIGKYLSRWPDFHMGEKVGGFTNIGGSRIKKSPWMINSSTINVFEADAVIVATPAIQAYGLVSTAQDEVEVKKMITHLDEISYTSTFSFMAGYGKRSLPDWKMIQCEHPVLSLVCNESSKRNSDDEMNIVAHTTDRFTKEMLEADDPEETDVLIREALKEVTGSWSGRPEWHQTHLWRYHQPKNSLDMPFLESEDELAPLAVIGDYFRGTSMEAAYLSGLRLGKHWAEKFS